jgi:hypothetical protein
MLLDDNDIGNFNLYDASFHDTDFVLPPTSDGVHTLDIFVLGFHQDASTDSIVSLREILIT